MSAQLFLLLFSLLPNTMAFPPIVDTLFNVYLANEVPLENRAEIVEPIEDGLTCKMEVEHELLERMGLQVCHSAGIYPTESVAIRDGHQKT